MLLQVMNFAVSDHDVVLNLKSSMGTESKHRAPNRLATKGRIITLDFPNASRFDKRPQHASKTPSLIPREHAKGAAILLFDGILNRRLNL